MCSGYNNRCAIWHKGLARTQLLLTEVEVKGVIGRIWWQFTHILVKSRHLIINIVAYLCAYDSFSATN